MKRYQVEITEVLKRTIVVEAADEQEAERKVRQMYRDCSIILDSSDYEQTEIRVKDEKRDDG